MKIWFWLISALVLIYVGLIIFKIFSRRREELKDEQPPDDIYPLW